MIVVCAFCGKETKVIRSRKRSQNFCGKSCKAKWQWQFGKLKDVNYKNRKRFSKLNTLEEIEAVAAAYRKGFSVKRISKEFHASRSVVIERLKGVGVKYVPRPRYGFINGGFGSTIEENKEKIESIIILSGAGMGDYVLGKQLGVMPRTILLWRMWARTRLKLHVESCGKCDRQYLYPLLIRKPLCFLCTDNKENFVRSITKFLGLKFNEEKGGKCRRKYCNKRTTDSSGFCSSYCRVAVEFAAT